MNVRSTCTEFLTQNLSRFRYGTSGLRLRFSVSPIQSFFVYISSFAVTNRNLQMCKRPEHFKSAYTCMFTYSIHSPKSTEANPSLSCSTSVTFLVHLLAWTVKSFVYDCSLSILIILLPWTLFFIPYSHSISYLSF